jgi:hypothetical protein
MALIEYEQADIVEQRRIIAQRKVELFGRGYRDDSYQQKSHQNPRRSVALVGLRSSSIA